MLHADVIDADAASCQLARSDVRSLGSGVEFVCVDLHGPAGDGFIAITERGEDQLAERVALSEPSVVHGDQLEVSIGQRDDVVEGTEAVVRTAFDGSQARVLQELVRGAGGIRGGDDHVVEMHEG